VSLVGHELGSYIQKDDILQKKNDDLSIPSEKMLVLNLLEFSWSD
jgi:hypothetical protein